MTNQVESKSVSTQPLNSNGRQSIVDASSATDCNERSCYGTAPRLAFKEGSLDQDFMLVPSSQHAADWNARLRDVFGVDEPVAADVLLQDLIKALQSGAREDLLNINGALALVREMKPRGSVEALLAVQIAVAHFHTIRQLRMSSHSGCAPYAIERTKFVLKFMDMTGRLTSRFQKLRQGGKQTVTVEHVTVQAGGAAMVGNIDAGGRKRGE